MLLASAALAGWLAFHRLIIAINTADIQVTNKHNNITIKQIKTALLIWSKLINMASKLAFLLAIVVVAAAPAIATDYTVGDDAGWKLNFNYTAWAQGKEFYVGDRISMFINYFIVL